MSKAKDTIVIDVRAQCIFMNDAEFRLYMSKLRVEVEKRVSAISKDPVWNTIVIEDDNIERVHLDLKVV